MSDMKAFTVRDMDRNPKKILQASDECGQAIIRSRTGRSYLLTPLPAEGVQDGGEAGKKWLREHRQWLGRQGNRKIPPSQVVEVDRLVAGE